MISNLLDSPPSLINLAAVETTKFPRIPAVSNGIDNQSKIHSNGAAERATR